MKIKFILFCLTLSLSVLNVYGKLPVGQKAPNIELQGELGGRVDGSPWKSEEIIGKVYTLFYVDPDEKELNQHVEKALKAENFSRDQYGSIAVINMDATWLPNFSIESSLKSKQKKFPRTIYVKDMKKELARKWSLQDDSYDVVAFDKTGTVIFSQDGQLSEEDIKTLITTIRENLNSP